MHNRVTFAHRHYDFADLLTYLFRLISQPYGQTVISGISLSLHRCPGWLLKTKHYNINNVNKKHGLVFDLYRCEDKKDNTNANTTNHSKRLVCKK